MNMARMHLVWCLNHYMNSNSKSTRYYLLSTSLITLRLGKSLKFQG